MRKESQSIFLPSPISFSKITQLYILTSIVDFLNKIQFLPQRLHAIGDPAYKNINKRRCLLCCVQDHTVTAGLKKIPGVPLLYIILNTIVLDKPSQASLDHVQAVQLGELVSPAQQQSIRSLKEEQGIGLKDGQRRGKKRKRKQSNPNPLSCLKKKKKGVPTPPLKKTETGEKRKRSRHKKQKITGDIASDPVITDTQ